MKQDNNRSLVRKDRTQGNSRQKEAVLVAHGINRQGKRVVLHLSLGVREGTESWKGVLNDLVERGLELPPAYYYR